MDLSTNGPDLSDDTESVAEQVADQKSKHEAHPLHTLQQEIAAMPAIDPVKVEAALLKIHAGTLEIFGSEEQRLASEARIAGKIIEETMLANTIETELRSND